jgi:hypothetical protein
LKSFKKVSVQIRRNNCGTIGCHRQIKHKQRIEKKSLRNCQTTPTIRLQTPNGKTRDWMDKIRGNSSYSVVELEIVNTEIKLTDKARLLPAEEISM